MSLAGHVIACSKDPYLQLIFFLYIANLPLVKDPMSIICVVFYQLYYTIGVVVNLINVCGVDPSRGVSL